MKFENYEDAKAMTDDIVAILSKYRKWNWFGFTLASENHSKRWVIAITGSVETAAYRAFVVAGIIGERYVFRSSIKWADHSNSLKNETVAKTPLAAFKAAERWLKKEIKRRNRLVVIRDLSELNTGGVPRGKGCVGCIYENGVRR